MRQKQSGQAAGAQKFAYVPRVPVPGMSAHAQTHVSTGENPEAQVYFHFNNHALQSSPLKWVGFIHYVVIIVYTAS